MRALFFTLTIAALAMPAGAHHCTEAEASETELSTCMEGIEVRCFYVDSEECQPQCFPSWFVYEETNGIEGLQRDDEVENNTCHGLVEADTIVF